MGGKLVDVAPAPHRSCGVMLLHARGILAVAPLLVLFGALLLDAWLGDMTMLFRRVPHPVALVGRAVAWFDVKLNREQRSEQARFARGIVTVTILVVAAVVAGYAIDLICRRVAVGWAVELFLIAVLLAQRSLFDRVQAVAAALPARRLPA